MVRFAAALASLLLVSATTEALLPPLYEGIREIKAILEDPELSQELTSGEVIEAIEKNDKGYEIQTNRSRLQVDVHALPVDHPGPAQFELEFHPVESSKAS